MAGECSTSPLTDLENSVTSQSACIQQVRATASPIRIGVVIAPGPQPKWVRNVLHEIRQAEFAQLAMVIRSTSAGAPPSPSSTRLFRLWRKWDDWYFGTTASLGETGDVDSEAVATIHVSDRLQAHHMRDVQAANLDVIVQLGDDVAHAELTCAARYGLWHYPGDQVETTDLAKVMIKGEGTFVTSLQVTLPSGRRLMDRAVAHLRKESMCRNQQTAALLKVKILMRRLKLLYQYGPACLPPEPHPPLESPQVDEGLSATRFLRRWAASAVLTRIENHVLLEQWFVAFRNRRGVVPFDMSGFHVIRAPADRFYADPFVISKNGHSYIFFEECRFGSQRGVISCMEVDEAGNHGSPVPVLEMSYHVSYPYLFTWQGETYLIPETCEAKRVEAYRALEFPYRWVREKVLMEDVIAVDPSLVEHDGRVWLFASGMSTRSWAANEELFLFSSDSLFGEWHSHPENPIVCDVRRARPAGQLFYAGGALIRPSQDCGSTYGYATVLNRVDVLAGSKYQEEPIATITPDWQPGNVGTHTFNQNELFQVVDGRTCIWRRRGN